MNIKEDVVVNKLNDEKLKKVSGGYFGPMNDEQNAIIDSGICPFCGGKLKKEYWWEAGHKSKDMWSMDCPQGHRFVQDVNNKKWASLI